MSGREGSDKSAAGQSHTPAPRTGEKIRVAAYARVSSNSADQLNSFITQVEYYAQYIQSKYAWEFAGLYADAAVIIGLKTLRLKKC